MSGQDKKFRKFSPDELLCPSNNEGMMGSGTFGVVWLGFHAIYNLVALKCMRTFGGARRVKILEKQIQRELESLENVSNENVVRVFGWTQWSNTVAMVMEYLPGGNLLELMDDEDVGLRPLLQLRMCTEVANGLSFLHNFLQQKRLVHGDIKAENILLTNDLHCKIADFGAATISSYTGGSTLTSTENPNKIQSTNSYAAPEFLANPMLKRKPSYDTYSFSILVYVVLGREAPRNAELPNYKDAVISGQRPDLENIFDYRRDIEESGQDDEMKAMDTLISVMQDCWQHDPSDRPTMLHVKDKLYDVLNGIPPATIQHIAASAVAKMEITIPMKKNYNCFPLHQLLPFSQIDQQPILQSSFAASTSMDMPPKHIEQPNLQSSFGASTSMDMPPKHKEQPNLQSSFGASTSMTSVSSRFVEQLTSSENAPEHTDLLQILRSIKSLLVKDEMGKAVNQIQQLVAMATVTRHADEVVNDVIEIAQLFHKGSKYLECLLVVDWCSAVFENIKDSQKKFAKVYDLCLVVDGVSRSMFKANMEAEIEESCLPLLRKLKEKLESIRIQNIEFKTKMLTWCSIYIGRCYSRIRKYEQSLEIA